MKRYVVMHNYGAYEGWKLVSEHDGIWDAVMAREADVTNGGGQCEIFQWEPVMSRYRDAEYQRPKSDVPQA